MEFLLSMLGLSLGFIIGAFVISTALCVFFIICSWRIYEKIGRSGWECLIPIYNVYAMGQALGCEPIAYACMGCMGGYFLFLILAKFLAFLGLLMFPMLVAMLVMNILLNVKLCEGLGKPVWMVVLCLLLPIVYYPILAFTD